MRKNLILLVTMLVTTFSVTTPALAQSKSGHIDDLVGSTFTCGGLTSSGGVAFKTIYTFFPNSRYTLTYYIPSTGRTLPLPVKGDYFYDGKVLKVEHYNEVAIVEVVFETTYLSKKNKMILSRDGVQQICNES